MILSFLENENFLLCNKHDNGNTVLIDSQNYYKIVFNEVYDKVIDSV